MCKRALGKLWIKQESFSFHSRKSQISISLLQQPHMLKGPVSMVSLICSSQIHARLICLHHPTLFAALLCCFLSVFAGSPPTCFLVAFCYHTVCSKPLLVHFLPMFLLTFAPQNVLQKTLHGKVNRACYYPWFQVSPSQMWEGN